ncbi:hypothetical protein U14_01251 [Candidatus Moduliflexus flocculans]|uniref:Uncharacterized protein n=1 Tax=Candidatus Moduliflexus flocculans TaxID=1499966 RepID=A0A0S6VRN2_9BACT|nr:hypothetical protein U14_01251 [Candidatus Moduliflexus flocculans]
MSQILRIDCRKELFLDILHSTQGWLYHEGWSFQVVEMEANKAIMQLTRKKPENVLCLLGMGTVKVTFCLNETQMQITIIAQSWIDGTEICPFAWLPTVLLMLFAKHIGKKQECQLAKSLSAHFFEFHKQHNRNL